MAFLALCKHDSESVFGVEQDELFREQMVSLRSTQEYNVFILAFVTSSNSCFVPELIGDHQTRDVLFAILGIAPRSTFRFV